MTSLVSEISRALRRGPGKIDGQSSWTSSLSTICDRALPLLRKCRFSFLNIVPAALALAFVTGCAVGPNYKRPVVNTPQQYRDQQGSRETGSIADLPWWEVFKDQQLIGLVKTALANNYDLQIAVTRIEQSRQIAAQARAQYWPFVNYSVASSYGRNEFLGLVTQNGGKEQGALIYAASVAWEADLWGRLRRENEAARAQFLSTEEARRGVMLSLVTDVAQAYFELLDLDLRLNIAKQATQSFTQSLQLFNQRLQGGVASKLDTSRAEGAQASAAANIPELERQIALKENQINVLLGGNPGPIPRTSKLLNQVVLPDIPAGLPAQLLERRPDILTAEQQLRFANAQVGVAAANYFPRVGLTALFGRASSPLSELSSGQSTVWSVAGDVAGPLFQGGSLRAQKRQAVAFWDESRLQYQQTAQLAFEDVSNALISRQKYEQIQLHQSRAVAAYQQSVTVAFQRYLSGKASYFEVLDAQQLLFPAEDALAVTELNRRTVVIQLYKALGGGWNLSDPDWIPTKN